MIECCNSKKKYVMYSVAKKLFVTTLPIDLKL